jgi:hypothetical protein
VQDGWQMVKNWRGLCPAVDYDNDDDDVNLDYKYHLRRYFLIVQSATRLYKTERFVWLIFNIKHLLIKCRFDWNYLLY